MSIIGCCSYLNGAGILWMDRSVQRGECNANIFSRLKCFMRRRLKILHTLADQCYFKFYFFNLSFSNKLLKSKQSSFSSFGTVDCTLRYFHEFISSRSW